MNMFLHNVNYDKFNIQLGNTGRAAFRDERPLMPSSPTRRIR
jgi:type I restriction-modification system DNA methylase subunit